MPTYTPACQPCKDGDHTHCRNWVNQGAELVYCACFWHAHEAPA
jgi:hypothetical protein